MAEEAGKKAEEANGKTSMENDAAGRKASMAGGGRRIDTEDAGLGGGKALDLDDVLVNELGQFGKFQLYNIMLVAFPIIASAFMSEYIFSAAAIPHR